MKRFLMWSVAVVLVYKIGFWLIGLAFLRMGVIQ